MSIFSKIKTAIFGEHGPLGGQFSGHKEAKPAPAPAQAQPKPAPTAPQSAPAAPQAAPKQPAPAQPAPAAQQPVDVEQVLTGIAQKKGNPNLNWRTSIVDLMKLLDLDSSLDNRKELATELGYTGAKDGSAEMNIWLHKAVMRELEKSGGAVPASMKD
jgi:3-oxoacyl-ACP reductase-like protein